MKLARLKKVRQSKALTQQELAEMAGVTRSTVARIEVGEEEPLPSTIRKLAGALGVRPEDLGPGQSDGAAHSTPRAESRHESRRALADLVADGHLAVAGETEVSGFLQGRPELAALIAEAAEQLRRAMPGSRLKVSLTSDPDYGAGRELFLGVSTHLGEDEALAALRHFDQSWWVHHVGRADGLLCIDLDDDEL